MSGTQFRVEDHLRDIPRPIGERFTSIFPHPFLDVDLCAPRGDDPQKPRTRDEAYIVVQGSGWFRCGPER